LVFSVARRADPDGSQESLRRFLVESLVMIRLGPQKQRDGKNGSIVYRACFSYRGFSDARRLGPS
jgi:hypothetical protein